MEQGSIANIPIVFPTAVDVPWLVAFTAIASSIEQNTKRTGASVFSGANAAAVADPLIVPVAAQKTTPAMISAAFELGEDHCFDYRSVNPSDASKQKCSDRLRLEQALEPLRTLWLTLEHGNTVVVIPDDLPDTSLFEDSSPDGNPALKSSSCRGSRPGPSIILADAALVTTLGYAAALTTADCLPIIVVCPLDRLVAVIHAGWRGLACGAIENTLGQLALQLGQIPKDTVAWIGPAIQQKDYEIDETVRRELMENNHIGNQHFKATGEDRYLADLQGMAQDILVDHGLRRDAIEVCPLSTRTESALHSARRDGSLSGRMATVVGIIAE